MRIQVKILNKDCTEDVTIYPGETKMLSTGLAISIDNDEVAAVILPRSGLGHKGLVLGNLTGLVDSDYQGELKISAWNRQPVMRHSKDNNLSTTMQLKAGDRIAQLMFMPVIKCYWDIVEEFSNKTDRDKGGFGSTGE
jgi:dUTP pyrophosphatase